MAKAKIKAEEKERILRVVSAYKTEAESARRSRIEKSQFNWDMYHQKQDYSHKLPGQSREFLPKLTMAVDQITSFLHQGLVDLGDWFSISASPGNENPLFSDDEARKILAKALKDADFYTTAADSTKSGLLSSLMILKVGMKSRPKAKYTTEKKKGFIGLVENLIRKEDMVKGLSIDLIRPENYYPDPTGERLYECEDIEMDFWQLKRLAKESPGDYDVEAVEALGAEIRSEWEKYEKERETNQNVVAPAARKRVKITEVWGTLVDEQGEVLFENGVVTVANDRFVIKPPTENPFWHQSSPYVVAPIVRVPWSVWHRAAMDAPAALNQAQNELFNLMFDEGMMSVFGVRQIRKHWVDNAESLAGGIGPNTVLEASPSCPPGQKVLETVSSSVPGQNSFQMFTMTNAEFSSASLTNDLRMGVLPSRSVKATEVVEASNSITSVLSGAVHQLEASFIQPALRKAWQVQMQVAEKFDTPEFKALLGEKRAMMIDSVSRKERFSRTVDGHDFRVFGITETLNKIRDFRKLTTMLQTIAQAPVLSEEFSRKYDFAKLLTEIMKSLDIDSDRIKLDQVDELMDSMGSVAGDEGVAGAPGAVAPDQMSQVAPMSGPESGLASPTPRPEMGGMGA